MVFVPFVDSRDYGIVGDGVTDDSANLQSALTDAAANDKALYCGSQVIKITQAITVAGAGLLFDEVPHGTSGGAGILVSGTGYTALTISGRPQLLAFTLRGTGNAADGVYFSNPQDAVAQHVRVYNLAGFGVKIDKCWDCRFGTISVENCGSDSKEAFSMNLAGDTSNMTHIERLQVEASAKRAIFIDADNLSCVIDNIHSDGTVVGSAIAAGSFVVGKAYTITTVGTTDFTLIGSANNTVGTVFVATGVGSGTGTATPVSWVLGGAGCLYNAVRLHAASGSGKAWLRGAYTIYHSLRVEGTITVDLEATSGTSITLVEPNITGVARETPNQTGRIVIVGGNQSTVASNWSGSKTNRYFVPEDSGPWTPALKFGGASTGMTYSGQSGTWTKIGKLVLVTCDFTLSAKGTSTGAATITGLPFAVAQTAGIAVGFYANLTGAAGMPIVCRADATGTAIIPAFGNADAAPSQLTDAAFTNTSRLILTGAYRSS